MTQEENQGKSSQEDFLWDILVAVRLYVIVLFIVLPVILLSINLRYIQPFSIILLIISLLIIIRFVLFEPRNYSNKYVKVSLAMLIPIACLIFLNFIVGFIFLLIHYNHLGIFLPLTICIVSFAYFYLMLKGKIFRSLNNKLISWKKQWSNRGKHTWIKQRSQGFVLIFSLVASIFLLFVPYPVYIQEGPEDIKGQTIGIWMGSGDTLKDDSMELLAEEDVYFVTTIKEEILDDNLVDWLTRCKDYEIEVHVSMSIKAKDIYSFVNVWTIEDLTDSIEEMLKWLDDLDLIGDPITTVVYDMEGLWKLSFLEYLMHGEVKSKLSEYYELLELFREFNEKIRDDYDLDIQICGAFAQGFDLKDGDDDIRSFYGLLSDEKTTRSYMIYRKDSFNLNYLVDSLRLLDKGDTIILNSWKFEGCMCWEDLDCVIEEARLVLGYPNKQFNLEIWRIDNFLDSYGIKGLHDFIEAITKKPSEWPVIIVWNQFPNAFYSDAAFFLYSLLDLYVPILKIIFHAY